MAQTPHGMLNELVLACSAVKQRKILKNCAERKRGNPAFG